MPCADVRDEKDKEEDDAKAIEPTSHPAPNHTLIVTDHNDNDDYHED